MKFEIIGLLVLCLIYSVNSSNVADKTVKGPNTYYLNNFLVGENNIKSCLNNNFGFSIKAHKEFSSKGMQS